MLEETLDEFAARVFGVASDDSEGSRGSRVFDLMWMSSEAM